MFNINNDPNWMGGDAPQKFNRDENILDDSLPDYELDTVEPITFRAMAQGIVGTNFAMVLLGTSISGAIAASFLQVAYLLPIFFALMLSARYLTRGLFWLIYRVVYRTKENRWMLNSMGMMFWTAPMWLIIPGCIYGAVILFLMIPVSLYNILYLHMHMPEAFMLYDTAFEMFSSGVTMPDLFQRVFFYDHTMPIISIIKMATTPFFAYWFYYGSRAFSKQEFLETRRDAKLIFE